MHKVYYKRGQQLQGVRDFDDFRKMMIEIGAIGVVTGETERYVGGLFEYNVPHKLVTSSYDELCLHPLFTEVYSAIKPRGDDIRVVYPFGSDISQEDWRELR